MPTLSNQEILTLLHPYLLPATQLPPEIPTQLSQYLDLLLKWNARTNLTAIRDPHEIVRRHFGESLFAAQHLGPCTTLMDLGSGAGFPGLPISLLHPTTAVTLAESQNKKSTFLREVVRTLDLKNVEVWSDRAESLPQTRQFHTVALRAVDNMPAALVAAQPRVTQQILILAGAPPTLSAEFSLQPPIVIPGTQSSHLYLATRS
jgi:16S rRNA (guanine527-N7)-methyltransferase